MTRSIATPAVKPTVRQWLLHLGLFLITGFTTTLCGVLMAGPDLEAAEGSGSILFV